MRITESQLRRIVREEILREAVYEKISESKDTWDFQSSQQFLEEAVQTREYRGKTYRATPQAVSILKKFNFDVTAAVSSGSFDWVKSRGGSPWAVAQAAYIVAKGEPIRKRPSESGTSIV